MEAAAPAAATATITTLLTNPFKYIGIIWVRGMKEIKIEKIKRAREKKNNTIQNWL